MPHPLCIIRGMSRVVTGVTDLVREECRTDMLHNDMTLARLMVMTNKLNNPNLRICLET